MAMLLAAANCLSCTIEVLQLSCISYQYHTFCMQIANQDFKSVNSNIRLASAICTMANLFLWYTAVYLAAIFLELKSLLMHLHFTTYTKREMELVFFHTHTL